MVSSEPETSGIERKGVKMVIYDALFSNYSGSLSPVVDIVDDG